MRFLVAIDGSDASDAALAHACELTDATDGSLTVAHAVSPGVRAEPDPEARAQAGTGAEATGDDLVSDPEAAAEAGAALLEEAAATVEDRGVTLDGTELLRGEPVEAVASFTREAAPPFDGVVVGHRGLSGRYEEMVGSVAKGLVGSAAAPVTVVRADDGHGDRSGGGR